MPTQEPETGRRRGVAVAAVLAAVALILGVTAVANGARAARVAATEARLEAENRASLDTITRLQAPGDTVSIDQLQVRGRGPERHHR